MRKPHLFLFLMLSACSNDLPKDPNIALDADADADTDADSDGDLDEGSPVDQDGDGHSDDVDCDDEDAAIFPGALEACDGEDNDCDGRIDDEDDDVTIGTTTYYADRDGDGLGDADGEIEACAHPVRQRERGDSRSVRFTGEELGCGAGGGRGPIFTGQYFSGIFFG